MKTANGETISFGYDALKRLKNIKSKHGSGTDFITQTYTYKDRAGQTTDGKQLTTNQIANIAYTGIVNPFNLSYEYDAIGNISKVSQGSTVVAEYQYDRLNQLISEKLPQQNLNTHILTIHLAIFERLKRQIPKRRRPQRTRMSIRIRIGKTC
ncbi:hypothetical protein [Butyricicoccus intestinisimiae]|uniref:RHS repeat protein n=1 Tax=Butyricicoccus intestinisimiae TaxID=2841509 RepID=A0ABS6EP30_9FIRM|nr:hypothetical protein [Butyricicoccus intestinisimiae]MBU5489449.1 hypothetical protein [Butyricicoccus intestinisimiae]